MPLRTAEATGRVEAVPAFSSPLGLPPPDGMASGGIRHSDRRSATAGIDQEQRPSRRCRDDAAELPEVTHARPAAPGAAG